MLDHPASDALAGSDRASEAVPRLDGAELLLVEDGATNRKLIGLILRRAGAVVHFAEHGQAALEALAARSFDLILMDMQMPVLDGYEATRRIRAGGYTGAILALTAHTLRGEAEACIEAGCNAHISKPIDHEALLETVRAYLPEVRCPVAEADRPIEPTVSCSPTCRNEAIGPPLISALPADDSEFREIVEEFVATLAEKIRAMRTAWERGDRAELAGLAHWLKGAGGTAGFDALTETARRLEKQVQLGTTDEIGRELHAMEQLARRVAAPSSVSV